MKRFYSYKLGEYLGNVYHLTVAGEPDINAVEEFPVSVHYFDQEDEEQVQSENRHTPRGRTFRQTVSARRAAGVLG